jgi:hypothetical protein
MKERTKNIKFEFYPKYLFIVSFLVLAVFLAGCGGVVPSTSQAPIITSTPITTATIGLLYTYDVDATDPDGDVLTYSFYSIYTAPSGMTINSTTGVISWAPTSIQIGNTLVMVKVSDGTLSATQSFTITVEGNTTYDLRDIGPAGGYIFYDKGSYSNGWRYLEVAPLSTEAQKEWGSYGTLIGGTGTGIGTGQSNTTKIVTWLNSHPETDRAAQLCDALVVNNGVTYSDWFLPSKDELNLMYTNLKVFGVSGFADYSYWSSSEVSADNAWYQNFSNGSQYHYFNSKPFTFRVRAVRAF